jgi:hypothetical protein
MGILDDGIDFDSVEEQSGNFDPIPEGEYTLSAVEYEERITKAGDEMLVIQYKVEGPNFANRRIWENFVLVQPVAQGRLKSWIRSTGGDIDRLKRETLNSAMNRSFQANVGIEKGNEQYPEDKNRIKSFKVSGATTAKKAPVSDAPQQSEAKPAESLQTASWS